MRTDNGHLMLSYSSTLPAFSNMSNVAAAAEVPFQPGNIINFNYAQKDMRFARRSSLHMGNGFQTDTLRGVVQSREMGTSRKVTRPSWSTGEQTDQRYSEDGDAYQI